MEDETGLRDSQEFRKATGMQASRETEASEVPRFEECKRGPGWKGWVFSILVTIILSVTATLLLGGSGSFSFQSDRAAAGGEARSGSGSGSGSSCCPPADAGK